MKKACTTLTTLIVSLMVMFIHYSQPLFLHRWLARRSPKVFYYARTREKVVALTIDDGPHPQVTPGILDALRSHEAKATFFIVGDYIKGNEHLLNRIVREGHEVGNHLERVFPSILLSKAEFERQLSKVDDLLQPWGPIKWLRPGSGWYTPRMLQQVERYGYSMALVSVYPQDTKVRHGGIISTYVLKKVFPGAIIVLHDGRADRVRTIQVLNHILPKLKQQGYQVVTLSDLAKLDSDFSKRNPA